MALLKLDLLVLLLYLGGILAEDDDIVIIPLRAYKCAEGDPLMEYDVNIRTVDDAGSKVLDVEVEMEYELNAQWMFSIKIDKWNNGAWDEDFYDDEGPMCQIINQYVSRGWKRLRNEISPPIEEQCRITQDTYKLDAFKVARTDYDIPVGLLGTYRVTGVVKDEYGSELICQVIEVETDKAR